MQTQTNDPRNADFGPWNPGIRSQLPSALLPLTTIFRPENGFVSAVQAQEMCGFTGLAPDEFATFRPERLAVHELLVRVTADFTVPDGPNYEDLGINFREIAATILSRHVAGHMDDIRRAYDDLKFKAAGFIEDELSRHVFAAAPAAAPVEGKRTGWSGFLGLFRKPANDAPSKASTATDRGQRALSHWRIRADVTDEPMERAAYEALIQIVTAISGKHGGPRGEKTLLTTLATNMVCNIHGSALIGEIIEPVIREAAARENFRLLPIQARPVVMNIKGASASGKSTMRPLQRNLAEKIGVAWRDFAVISPDIWRKYLLDYLANQRTTPHQKHRRPPIAASEPCRTGGSGPM